jgi:hypothetical protein
MVNVRIYDPQKGRTWEGSLRESAPGYNYPALTWPWLSPVDRGDTYFSIADEERYGSYGGKWRIIPEYPQGSSLVHYELPNIKLCDYLVTK